MSSFDWRWAVPVDVLARRPGAVIAKARRDAVACAAAQDLRPASGQPTVTCPPPDEFGVVEVRVTFPTAPRRLDDHPAEGKAAGPRHEWRRVPRAAWLDLQLWARDNGTTPDEALTALTAVFRSRGQQTATAGADRD